MLRPHLRRLLDALRDVLLVDRERLQRRLRLRHVELVLLLEAVELRPALVAPPVEVDPLVRELLPQLARQLFGRRDLHGANATKIFDADLLEQRRRSSRCRDERFSAECTGAERR